MRTNMDQAGLILAGLSERERVELVLAKGTKRERARVERACRELIAAWFPLEERAYEDCPRGSLMGRLMRRTRGVRMSRRER